MTNNRPSRTFIFAMLGLGPLLIGGAYVLNRNGHSLFSNGESLFSDDKDLSAQESASSKYRDSKSKRVSREANAQRCEAWFQEILARHPDMAVASKNVPDEQNGFLKLLDFADHFKKTSATTGLEIPKEFSDYLAQQGEWNAEATRAWLTQNQSLLDEIRAIGLMPNQSNHGIKIERYGFINARLPISCVDALMMEARLAAGDGNVAGALVAVRAASGIGNHLNQIETPSFLTETITTVVRQKVQGFALNEILHALPADAIDVAAWEAALHPTVSSPAEFSRILKGEWNVGMQQFVLPFLSSTGDPEPPPDPEKFIDVHTEMFRRVINANASMNPEDLSSFTIPSSPSSAGLSRESRSLYDDGIMTNEGTKAWRKGWVRTQSIHGMMQAAFAIMKGQPVPNDPIYGMPYVWDPATRTLAQPNDKVFDELKCKPITVPQP